MIVNALARKKVEILAHVEKRLAHFKRNKQTLDRLFYTSILFYRGEQWVTFDTNIATFRRTNQRRVIPKPVTNKFAPTCNSIMSSLSRFDPKLTMAPQTDSEEDMITAQASTRIEEMIKREVNWEKRKTELTPWLVLNGNVFVITGVDESRGTERQMMQAHCRLCGYEDAVPTDEAIPDCPQCWQQGIKSGLEPVYDGRTQQPKVFMQPTGQLTVDLGTPFEMFMDYRVQDLQQHQTIIRIHNKDVDWAKARWPKIADKIQSHKRPELNARIISALAQLTFPTAERENDNTVDLVEVWEKPSPQFEEGFYCVYSQDGGVLHDLEPFPFRTNTGEPLFPITHFPFDKVPGSLLARTPAFDLVDKQRQRNRLEAIIEMILMRMSNPVWLMPTPGTETTPTGIPGQVLKYDPHQTNGLAPNRIEGAQLTNGPVLWIDRIDRDFAEISGQYEVARGERPLSVKSAAAIDRLRDIAADRNVPLFTNFAIAEAEWMQQAFELFRRITPANRYYRILGEDASWTVNKLQEADLRGAVDIWIEPGASIPRSHLEKLATLDVMLKNGLLNPADPLQLVKIHRMYGMPGLLPSMSADDAYIAREHDRFKRGNEIQVNQYDNHPLHFQRHLDFFKSETFETLPPEAQQYFFQHIATHQQFMQPAPEPEGEGQQETQAEGGQEEMAA